MMKPGDLIKLTYSYDSSGSEALTRCHTYMIKEGDMVGHVTNRDLCLIIQTIIDKSDSRPRKFAFVVCSKGIGWVMTEKFKSVVLKA